VLRTPAAQDTLWRVLRCCGPLPEIFDPVIAATPGLPDFVATTEQGRTMEERIPVGYDDNAPSLRSRLLDAHACLLSPSATAMSCF
jgi:hypothetical protein